MARPDILFKRERDKDCFDKWKNLSAYFQVLSEISFYHPKHVLPFRVMSDAIGLGQSEAFKDRDRDG